jgi:hypothetical protein
VYARIEINTSQSSIIIITETVSNMNVTYIIETGISLIPNLSIINVDMFYYSIISRLATSSSTVAACTERTLTFK